jgi:hypothetical protein
MTTEQIKEYAEEAFDYPQEALRAVLQDLIDKHGWLYDTTMEEAVQSHSKAFEKNLKQYKIKLVSYE